ncbi:carbohydrate ABC transporter permease [Paenibacillus xylanivorans]|uniref:carbohydrate ABC transporter permease n=1 Tax=Paenibacillus xylanivorans TaxID=1705561 RepID=UPI0006B16C0E|nr:carbohydrate ABC transporter permease [Paenibacillus xylanivorans]
MKEELWFDRAKNYARDLLWRRESQRLKALLMGRNLSDGLLAKLIIYVLLSIVAYLYLQPLLYMITTMLKTVSDLLDPSVKWIPRVVTWENLTKAYEGLRYPEALRNTAVIALTCSLVQVLVCSMTGYALARLAIPFKGLITALVLLTFLIPPQVIIIPLYVIFSKLGLLNSLFVFLVPAIFGQGLKGALFILIFRQFFKSQPPSLEEAAKLDGASVARLYFRIMLPLAQSACLVVFLFSFIWYWNMYYEPSMFLAKGFTPLSIRLDNLEEVLNPSLLSSQESVNNPVTEGTKMAAAFLIIFPPMLIFMFLQRWFITGIERTGIVE